MKRTPITPIERLAIRLACMQGLSQRETAKVFNVSPTTVGSTCFVIRSHMFGGNDKMDLARCLFFADIGARNDDEHTFAIAASEARALLIERLAEFEKQESPAKDNANV